MFIRKKPKTVLPKLVIEADEPAIFYGSIDRAESDLEPIDVEDGVYKAAYGPQGQCYKIESNGDSVVISLDASQPPDPARLKALLLRFLSAVKVPATTDETLEDLLFRCAPYTE